VPKSMTYKILGKHLIAGNMGMGQEIGIRIDQTLLQDATGTMALQYLDALKVDRIKTELSLTYTDHNTLQVGPENADDHLFLQSASSRYGVVYSKAGNGICHEVHLERFGVPGKTLLGADSHTPTCGALGMLAIGAGGLDVALAMAGVPFFLHYPKVINIILKDEFQPWVSAKDLSLKILEIFSTQGNVGCIFEFTGEGVKSLTVPDRATISNMGAECGVVTSVFPSDERTRDYLRSQAREHDWTPMEPDLGAIYDKVVEIDLGGIEPKVAVPHSPGNVKNVREIAGIKVDQVCIGSCTNSSFRDLMIVREILRNNKVHPQVSLVIAIASKQLSETLCRDSTMDSLLASGARIQEAACGFCMGACQSPPTNGVSVRTNNRNFKGRSGTQSAQVYLTSPETAATSAVTGKMTDPRTQGLPYPKLTVPTDFVINDNLLVYPPESGQDIRIQKGPHMGDIPVGSPLGEFTDGEVTIKVGNQVTTDHIIPAGSRLKYRSNIAKYAEFTFENLDPMFYKRALTIRDQGRNNFIVAGFSYGQGSSREHAALCPMYLGVKVVIAKSIERIHKSNLVNFGVVPLVLADGKDYDSIEQGNRLEIKDFRHALSDREEVIVANTTTNNFFRVNAYLTQREREILLSGGAISYNLRRFS
jgi:aconitate hydratase